MIAVMPPEDLPPPGLFPDSSPATTTGDEREGEDAPMLSAAQREEFAGFAGTLEAFDTPASLLPPAAPPDDFLITPLDLPSSSLFGNGRQVEKEEPPHHVDLLAVPGAPEPPAAVKPEGFSLQSLASALAVPPPRQGLFPGESQPPAVAETADIPPPSPGLTWPPEPGAPLIIPPLPGAIALEVTPPPVAPPAKPAADTPSLFPLFPIAREREKEKEKEAAVPLVPSPVPAPVKSAPVPVKPAPVFKVVSVPVKPVPDPEPEPVLVPAAFVVPETAALSAPSPASNLPLVDEPSSDRGVWVILAGAFLVLLGIFLAGRVPFLGLEAEAASVSSRPFSGARADLARAAMLLHAAGAACCLLLGAGAITLRRWAPPLIHAAGWVVLLAVLTGMGAAAAFLFYLPADTGDTVPGESVGIFAAAAIFGIALPLALIAVFQRPEVAALCRGADAKPRWTDQRAVPALMVFTTGVLLAIAALTLALAHAALPLFGEIQDSGAAAAAWIVLGLLSATAAGFAAMGKRLGWWLLLGLSAMTGISLFLTAGKHDWHTLLHLPAAGDVSTADGVMAACALLPVVLILLITRKAFSRESEV